VIRTRGVSGGEEVKREGDGEGLEGGGGRREAVVRGKRRWSVMRRGRARCMARRGRTLRTGMLLIEDLNLGSVEGALRMGFRTGGRRCRCFILRGGGVALQTLSVSAVAVEHGHREPAY